MSQNVLYFSNQCAHSQELIKELKEHKLIDTIKPICIDNRNVRIPPFLKEVPTLVVTDSENPLVGEDAFKWIKWKVDKKVKEEEKNIGAYGFGGFSESFSCLEGVEDEGFANDTSNFSSLGVDNTIMTGNEDSAKEYGDINQKLDALKKERGVM